MDLSIDQQIRPFNAVSSESLVYDLVSPQPANEFDNHVCSPGLV